MSKLKYALFLLLAFAMATAAQAPATAGLPVTEAKLASKLMGRDMPYRVIVPKRYKEDKSARYPVLYLLHGLTGHYDDWTNKTKLSTYAENFNYIIVTPEGNNGWYSNSGSVAADKYESYIAEELIAEIDANYRTLADRGHRAIAGLSMGGYGSLKFGLKYPEKFVVVGSFSGALMAASLSIPMAKASGWKAVEDSITGVYGEDGSQTRKENDIFAIARALDGEKLKAMPFFYLDCGTEDGLIGTNRDFAAVLMEKKLPHEFRQLPGKHDWVFWDSQVQEFLRLSQKFIK